MHHLPSAIENLDADVFLPSTVVELLPPSMKSVGLARTATGRHDHPFATPPPRAHS